MDQGTLQRVLTIFCQQNDFVKWRAPSLVCRQWRDTVGFIGKYLVSDCRLKTMSGAIVASGFSADNAPVYRHRGNELDWIVYEVRPSCENLTFRLSCNSGVYVALVTSLDDALFSCDGFSADDACSTFYNYASVVGLYSGRILSRGKIVKYTLDETREICNDTVCVSPRHKTVRTSNIDAQMVGLEGAVHYVLISLNNSNQLFMPINVKI